LISAGTACTQHTDIHAAKKKKKKKHTQNTLKINIASYEKCISCVIIKDTRPTVKKNHAEHRDFILKT
jgi:hypothetical protein